MTEGQVAEGALYQLNIEEIIADILATIDKDREREIISRRFGLHDRKETLEQIGELLGITRERVRQLEKSIVNRLKEAAKADLPHIKNVTSSLETALIESGNASTIKNLSAKFSPENTKIDQSRLAFLARLVPNLSVVEEDDSHHLSVGLSRHHDDKSIKNHVKTIVEKIKEAGEPVKIDSVKHHFDFDSTHIEALASISKKLATLGGDWGLIRWPTVNPKNIRDKIYLVLRENKQPMHFSKIAEGVQNSDFKRRDVTTQAIHNELIKDKRFVLIGRGIYALKEWGFSRGTVADVIADVLKEAGEPLHREEITKRVLKRRQVKETTILLNLQGKPQFKRVAKATYTLDETQQ